VILQDERFLDFGVWGRSEVQLPAREHVSLQFLYTISYFPQTFPGTFNRYDICAFRKRVITISETFCEELACHADVREVYVIAVFH
jgi:hypothetical protein